MEKYLLFFPFFIFPILISFFIYIYTSASKKHEKENGLSPLLEFRTGGIIGWIKYTGPFIRIAIYKDFIILSTNKKIILRFNEFVHQKGTYSFTKTIVIIHNKPEFPKRIELFSNSNFESFFKILEERAK